ncbi:MAG: HAD-IC family P-type ATPase [Anaerolineae bacterium]|jgi:cation-transporting ATPase E
MADAVGVQTPFRGLSESEAVAHRERGLGNDVRLKTSRTYGDILRENVFTFFNMVLLSLGLLLLLLGSPKDAFFTATIALLNVVVATVQEVRAKIKLDRIALLARPKATVIRDGTERELDPSQVVLNDLLVASPGDQIVVDGQVVSDSRCDVDESLLSGESDAIPKVCGDQVYSGSFVLAGRLVYEATTVGQECLANKLTEGARTFTREYTPLQREVDLMVRLLLIVVAFFGLMLALNYFIYQDVSLVDSVRAASVVFGLAPSSLFLMIVTAYALGAVRIAGKGALVQQANSVESLCHVNVLCLDKTGTLTANQIHLDEIHPLGAMSEAKLRRLLGAFAHSVTAGNKTSEAIAEACPGQLIPVREEVVFSSVHKWSALTFDQPDRPGIYVLGAPEVLWPHVAGSEDATFTGDTRLVGTLTHKWEGRGLRVLLFAHRPEAVSLHDQNEAP